MGVEVWHAAARHRKRCGESCALAHAHARLGSAGVELWSRDGRRGAERRTQAFRSCKSHIADLLELVGAVRAVNACSRRRRSPACVGSIVNCSADPWPRGAPSTWFPRFSGPSLPTWRVKCVRPLGRDPRQRYLPRPPTSVKPADLPGKTSFGGVHLSARASPKASSCRRSSIRFTADSACSGRPSRSSQSAARATASPAAAGSPNAWCGSCAC